MLQQLLFKLSNGHFARVADPASFDRSPRMSIPPRGEAHPGHLHICFVLPPTEGYYSRSGGAISTVTRQLARSLIDLGHSVDVITPDDGEQHYVEGNVHRLRYGPALPPPDLIHKAHVLEARVRGWSWPDYGPYLRNVSVASAASDPSPDLVIVANDPELAYQAQPQGHRAAPGALAAQSIAGEGSTTASSFEIRRHSGGGQRLGAGMDVDTYGIPADSISVIHNGIDLDEFHPRDGFIRLVPLGACRVPWSHRPQQGPRHRRQGGRCPPPQRPPGDLHHDGRGPDIRHTRGRDPCLRRRARPCRCRCRRHRHGPPPCRRGRRLAPRAGHRLCAVQECRAASRCRRWRPWRLVAR